MESSEEKLLKQILREQKEQTKLLRTIVSSQKQKTKSDFDIAKLVASAFHDPSKLNIAKSDI